MKTYILMYSSPKYFFKKKEYFSKLLDVVIDTRKEPPSN